MNNEELIKYEVRWWKLLYCLKYRIIIVLSFIHLFIYFHLLTFIDLFIYIYSLTFFSFYYAYLYSFFIPIYSLSYIHIYSLYLYTLHSFILFTLIPFFIFPLLSLPPFTLPLYSLHLHSHLFPSLFPLLYLHSLVSRWWRRRRRAKNSRKAELPKNAPNTQARHGCAMALCFFYYVNLKATNLLKNIIH